MKIGFAGHITLDKMEPYTSMTLKGSGRGKIDVSLQDQGSSTLVSYMVSANLGGRFMRLGESVVSGFAKSVADRFFSRLEKSISSR
jgi:carbon monoxide dehydrogenase subunit G